MSFGHLPPLTDSAGSQKHIDKREGDYHKTTSIQDLAKHGYIIGEELGEGSHCKVNRATFNEKDISVKIITKSKLSEDMETRFLPREISILSQIEHPNIIHIYNIYNYPNHVFIFMEYIKRGDLLDYIKKRGRLMEPEAYNFFVQLISAVQYLHNLDIAHRDLKCENIMITQDDVIKLIDFGFSRHTIGKDGSRELSHTYCGSPAYASPEVLQGIPYNPMFYDVWSLGIVLYIMVTGRMPFDDSDRDKMIERQLRKKLKFPKKFVVSDPIKNLISSMLEPDVCRRSSIDKVARSDWIVDNKNKFQLPSNQENAPSTSKASLEQNPKKSTDTESNVGSANKGKSKRGSLWSEIKKAL